MLNVEFENYNTRSTYTNKHTVTTFSYLVRIFEWLYAMSLIMPCLEFLGFHSHVVIVINNSYLVIMFIYSKYALCGEAFKQKFYVIKKFKDFLVSKRYIRTLALK